MPRSMVTLFNAGTGASTKVDAGDGSGASRMRSWLEEIPRWLKESVEPVALKGLGLGRLANYPAFLNGEQLAGFDGLNVYEVVSQTVVLATGDASAVLFGDVALTDGDRASANYFNTTTDPDDPVAPAGGQAPAFLQTISDGGGDFALTATTGVLTLDINGERFTVTGLIDETSTEVVARLAAFGLPADVVDGASGTVVRIFAPGNGVASNIKAVTVAGDAGTVLFTGAGASSQPNVLYRGTNGPLGALDNTLDSAGGKVQRKILPGSVSISATVSSTVETAVDDSNGGISGGSIVAANSTINYTTGAIHLDYTGNAPDAAAITATWKVLRPLTLTDPARLPPSGKEIAIELA